MKTNADFTGSNDFIAGLAVKAVEIMIFGMIAVTIFTTFITN